MSRWTLLFLLAGCSLGPVILLLDSPTTVEIQLQPHALPDAGVPF
jgi:hypothetical protein